MQGVNAESMDWSRDKFFDDNNGMSPLDNTNPAPSRPQLRHTAP